MIKKPIITFLLSSLYIFSFAQWVPLNSGTPNYLSSIYFVDDSIGFVGDEYGYDYKTIDGGLNWSPIGQHGEIVYFLSRDTGFAAKNGINKTNDGGSSWFSVFTTNNFISTIHFPDSVTGYASAYNQGKDSVFIYKTINNGNSWSDVSNHRIFIPYENTGLFFTSKDTGYAVADGIRKTTDGGLNWILQDSTGVLNSVYFPSRDTGYVVANGMILKTTDGQNWTTLSNPFPGTILNSIYFLTNEIGYIAGGNGFNVGTILKTTDGGINWVSNLTTPYHFMSIYFTSTGKGFACGMGGEIYSLQNNVSINDIYNEEIQIFPNPSYERFRIKYNGTENVLFQVQIFDLYGTLIAEGMMKEFDMSGCRNGVYSIRLNWKGKITNKQIVLLQ